MAYYLLVFAPPCRSNCVQSVAAGCSLPCCQPCLVLNSSVDSESSSSDCQVSLAFCTVSQSKGKLISPLIPAPPVVESAIRKNLRLGRDFAPANSSKYNRTSWETSPPPIFNIFTICVLYLQNEKDLIFWLTLPSAHQYLANNSTWLKLRAGGRLMLENERMISTMI